MFEFDYFVVGTTATKLRLNKGAVPHIFPWNERGLSNSSKHRRERGEKRKRLEMERDAAAENVGAYVEVDLPGNEGIFF